MKKTKKRLKRDIHRNNSHPADRDRDTAGSDKQTDNAECTETTVEYCNQWECFSRTICREDQQPEDYITSFQPMAKKMLYFHVNVNAE